MITVVNKIIELKLWPPSLYSFCYCICLLKTDMTLCLSHLYLMASPERRAKTLNTHVWCPHYPCFSVFRSCTHKILGFGTGIHSPTWAPTTHRFWHASVIRKCWMNSTEPKKIANSVVSSHAWCIMWSILLDFIVLGQKNWDWESLPAW